MQNAILILGVILVGLVAFVMTRPNTFRVTRRIVVNAPCEVPRQLVDDFRNWAQWSPFEHLDPDMEKTFEGAAEGKGAVYRWSGKGKAGAGRMEIVEATSNMTIIRLNFLKPFNSESITEFVFEPTGGGCEVTWSMHGDATIPSKLMNLVTNMDKMVGPDFEKGLASLKAVSERRGASSGASS